jgi:DNA-binding transcriptional MerR regulator
MTIQGTRWYTIRETAQASGLAESTLRYYESVGILEPARRDVSSGHRVYSEADIDAILTVSCLNATGMPLDDMRDYLNANRSGNPEAGAQIELLSNQQKRLKEQERQLKLKQKYLALKVRYWKTRQSGSESDARAIALEAAGLVQKLHTLD